MQLVYRAQYTSVLLVSNAVCGRVYGPCRGHDYSILPGELDRAIYYGTATADHDQKKLKIHASEKCMTLKVDTSQTKYEKNVQYGGVVLGVCGIAYSISSLVFGCLSDLCSGLQTGLLLGKAT